MRLYFLFVLSLSFVVPVSAQMGYGPEAGIGMSNMHFAPAEGFTSASTSPQASGKIGGIIDYGLNRKAYLQTGLYFSRKGQSRSFSFDKSDSLNEYVDQKLTINYIDLPVNLLYKTGIQGKGRFSLGVGVTASYIIGGRNKMQAYGKSNDTPYTVNNNTRIVKGNPLAMFDLGVNLVGGYEFPTGLFIRAYYTAGIKDIGLGSESDKNRIWGLSAGYFFGKGRNINKDIDDLIDKGD